MCVFLPVHVTLVSCVFAATRALTRRSYMADSTPMPTVVESSFGEADNSISLHAFCPLGHRFTSRARCFLSDLLLWCLYQNNLIPGRLCVMGALKAMRKKYLGGRACWMALTSPNPHRNIWIWLFFLFPHTQTLWCYKKYQRQYTFWKVKRCFLQKIAFHFISLLKESTLTQAISNCSIFFPCCITS